MKFSFNASGANAPLIREYAIASGTAVKVGEALGMADSLAVAAADGDFLLGVCAEDHPGTHDEFNARADGTKIRVNIAPDAVYETALTQRAAISGSASTLVVDATGLSTNVNSGYVMLISKTETSANTDAVGAKRRISACAISGGNATLTVESAGTPSAGDVYLIVPDIGDELYLDAAGTGVCFYSAASTVKLLTVYTDPVRGVLGVKFKAPLLS
ncbi:MAG: hypothetical protein ACI4RV_03825 [Eubacteriales bacterium]